MNDYVYTVLENDKPSVIAARLTGDSNMWLELMSYNTGLTPNKWVRYGNTSVPVYHLRVGQRISIPNHWIKDIPNQLIHTTQGFIGGSNNSPYFDPAHTNLKQTLFDIQNFADYDPVKLATYFDELGAYFCDLQSFDSDSIKASECINQALTWLNIKGGIFEFLPGNWFDSLNEDEIMDRINTAKDLFKKMPVYIKKTNFDDVEDKLYIDAYNQGYNVGYKQDGSNAAQTIINGTYILNQDVTGVNTSDIPVVMSELPQAPNIIKSNYDPDYVARKFWLNYWKQGWTDGYTDGFRETLANSDYGVEQKDQVIGDTIIKDWINLSELEQKDQNKEEIKDQKSRGWINLSELEQKDHNKEETKDQKQDLDKDDKVKQDQASKDGFPWGWAIFGGVIIAGGTVAYLNKDKIVSYFR